MALTQPPQLNIPNQNPISPRFWFAPLLKFVRDEASYIRRGLSSGAVAGLFLASLLLLTLAWQAPLDWDFKLGSNTPDFLYIRGFNPAERNQNITFRWSSDDSSLRFPGVGVMPVGALELTMQVGGRPAKLGDAHLQVFLGKDGPLLGEATVGPGLRTYRFDFKSAPSDTADLIFTLHEPDAFVAAGHDRPLGVVVTEVRLTGGVADYHPVVPAPVYLAVLLAALIIFYLALVRTGWHTSGAALVTALAAIGAAWALAFARLQFTPVVETLFLTLLLAYPLLVLGLRTTSFWLNKRRAVLAAKEAIWLGLIFVLAFVVKGVGLNHPAFLTIDHWFRVHQILSFVNTPNQFWQQYFHITTGQAVSGLQGGSAVLGQWGVSVQLPYSPLFYLLAAPLAFIWPTHDPHLLAAVNLLATWLEVSQIWLLYIIAKRAYRAIWSGWAGIIAAALYSFYPLSFLLFSDGGYNSILAQWLTLFFMTLLVDGLRPTIALSADAAPPTWSRGRWLGLVLTLAGALLAHTATLLLLGAFIIVLTVLLYLVKTERNLIGRVSLVSVGGFGLAFLLYYGFYLVGFLTQTLPTLFQSLQSQGALGQNQHLLGTPLLSGFWPQLWEHFRLFPFVLTLLALLLLWPFSSRWLRFDRALESRDSRRVYLIWAAWFVVFLLFALVDLKVNLLQKHLLFVAPLLCLGSGLALCIGREFLIKTSLTRSTNSRLPNLWPYAIVAVGIGLIAFNFWQGVVLWYERVFYYILPPGSG